MKSRPTEPTRFTKAHEIACGQTSKRMETRGVGA